MYAVRRLGSMLPVPVPEEVMAVGMEKKVLSVPWWFRAASCFCFVSEHECLGWIV